MRKILIATIKPFAPAAVKKIRKIFSKEGYEIKVVDLINFEKSNHYNPFNYINDEKDVIKLINNLIRNTTPKADRFDATRLGRLLADHASLRLVLLNSCEGARGSERDVFSSAGVRIPL